MQIHGRVHNGFVVLEGGISLPEGTEVVVLCSVAPAEAGDGHKKRVEFPLVRSKHAGTVNLANERIGELLVEEDVSPRH